MISKSFLWNYRWALAAVAFMSLIYILPFIIHENYIIDDWLRSDTGVTAWEDNARPLASVIMWLFSLSTSGFRFFGDGVLLDTFPFTLIASTFCIVLAALIVVERISIRSNVLVAISSISLLTSPFWIGNMLFRHDSFIMGLSALSAVCFSIVLLNSGPKRYFWGAALGFVVFTTYQASVNVIFSTMLLIICSNLYSGEHVKKQAHYVIRCAISLIISAVLYKLCVKHVISLSEYTQSHENLVSFDLNGLKRIGENSSNFYAIFRDAMKGFNGVVTWVVMSASIVLGGFLSKRRGLNLPSVIVITITPVALFSLTAGIMLILQNPVASSRVMIAFGFVLIYFCWLLDKYPFRLKMILPVTLVLCSFSLSSTVSGVVNDMQRLDRFVASYAAEKLYENGYKKGMKVYIFGGPSYPPSVERSLSARPFLKDFVYSSFANGRFKHSLMKQYGIISSPPSGQDFWDRDRRMNSSTVVYSDRLIMIYRLKDEMGFRVLK